MGHFEQLSSVLASLFEKAWTLLLGMQLAGAGFGGSVQRNWPSMNSLPASSLA